MVNRIALSGKLRAGKDHVAGVAGFTTIGFADPIYRIAEWFFGTSDKKAPGMRKFLQNVGQWGWGCTEEGEYDLNTNRALFVDYMRTYGDMIFSGDREYDGVDWDQYGRKKTFWVDILLQRADHKQMVNPDLRLAVVNARYPHELGPMLAAGFEYYHVMCSQETRVRRIIEADGKFDPEREKDPSERMAQVFDNIAEGEYLWAGEYGKANPEIDRVLNGLLSGDRVVWNDPDRPAPYSFLSLDEFVKAANTAKKAA